MSEKPILFSTEMVRALLDGRKSMTRRVVKPQPEFESGYDYPHEDEVGIYWKREESYSSIDELITEMLKKSRYQVGDILYVRETWCKTKCFSCKANDNPYSEDECEIERNGLTERCDDGLFAYKATDNPPKGYKWRPSIHMPRKAARILLRVTNVRVERLREITEEDAIAEGISWLDEACYSNNGWTPTLYDPDSGGSPVFRDGFTALWDSLNAERGYGWNANPWVWVIEFERVQDES